MFKHSMLQQNIIYWYMFTEKMFIQYLQSTKQKYSYKQCINVQRSALTGQYSHQTSVGKI